MKPGLRRKDFKKDPNHVPVKTQTVPAPLVSVNTIDLSPGQSRMLLEGLYSLLGKTTANRNVIVGETAEARGKRKILNRKVEDIEELIRRFQEGRPAVSPSCAVTDWGTSGKPPE
jgi:hypothetical protein